ncbi:GNAT family N-acetyltransferase [Butyrivibrio sp. YAB3001]|uniref:GNAT family N-acetyltransferase n=1 Tax=Butyrivibrio sp. YAB3001 TaxID=1520812 RepID=UPI0008F66F58|nr:GNAT family N-acetyltransferase [Butyrivibrio sp. YAB3001]SFB74079.1 phosphinothricin acetyltransferase [Butyrivibrio sp. YAB3001]
MRIEKVSVSDAKELLEIYAPYVENTAITFEYEVPGVLEFESRIKNISAKYPYIKAVDDNGKILGYAYATSFKGRKAYDWSVESTVYVREDHKRGGVGKKLYEALETSLAKMGILNVNACIAFLKEGVSDAHLTNDSFFFHEKMGYTLVGTFHDSGYKFGTWYDMIWMEKMLGQHSTSPMDVAFGKWDI